MGTTFIGIEMIGLSPGMTQLKKEIEIVAASDLNVLSSGETGTGKELVAKAIHDCLLYTSGAD